MFKNSLTFRSFTCLLFLSILIAMNLHRPLPKWLPLILCVVVLVLAGFADEDARYRKIRNALQKFTYMYPQQKVFLHIDKPAYRGGENIWVKAYLVNGNDHLPDTISTNLYVELISPGKTRIQIKRFQMFSGFGIGDFTLSDTLAEGLYQIRAYTSWMQNFDGDFYYSQNFQLLNPGYRKLISPKQARVNRREIDNREKLEENLDIQFMPEGGDLVTGLESVVGFKAVNRLGKGTDVEGSVVDDAGNTVAAFRSNGKGIGSFTMKPEKGRKYYAVIPMKDKEVKVSLPEPLETGLIMHVTNHPDRVVVSLRTNRPATADPTANEIILTGQTGGSIYYHNILRLENGEALAEIPKARIPGGIMQITAFSGRGEPLAERLVFVNHMNYMKIRYVPTDTLTDEGRKIYLTLIATDMEDNPLQANLSLSVTREILRQPQHNRDNIISNLLLASDLKGYIEDPLDYFKDRTSETLKALDDLMLTQGWRRFDWNSILADEFPKIKYHEEKGLTVFGQITRDFFAIPLKNCKVQLSILDAYNDVFTQQSSSKGYFIFENLVYYDTVSVKIEAWRPSGRRNLLIVLPDELPGKVMKQQGDYQLTTLSERDNKAFRIERSVEAREAYNREQELLKEEEKNQIPSLHGEPDYVLRSEDFPTGSRDILEVMKGRVPGLNITGNQIYIRGINSIMGSNQPLFLIDGVPTQDVEAIKSIPVEDIDRVEILKGPNTAIYGVRGGNGVIAVYTKRGQFMKRGVVEFDMLGYSRPRQFYQPRYQPEDEPEDNYTLVWEPLILTDKNGVARIVFDKPPINGDYRFIVQGISYEGHAGFAETVINNQ